MRQAQYTHRRRDETVLSRRVGVCGVYMNSQLAHDQCWGRVNSNEFNSRVNSFTVSYEFELTHLRDGEL